MALLAVATTFLSCSKDEDKIEPIVITLQDSYSVDRCKVLDITPAITGDAEATYKWTVTNDPENKFKDKVLANTKTLQFIAIQPGTYALKLTVTKPGLEEVKAVTVAVADAKYMVGISEVLDYNPAPGYGVNNYYFDDDVKTLTDHLKQFNRFAKRESSQNLYLYLGTYGGNATFKFDHTIANVTNGKDIEISTVSPEVLGVVMVAYDKNKNGKPDDDEWYEIEGSEHKKPTTIRDFQITYSQPNYDTRGEELVGWIDSKGASGTLKYAYYGEDNSLYPQWLIDQKLTYKGTLILHPGMSIDALSKTWGYAGVGTIDNKNGSYNTSIDIDWAIDKNGKSIKLIGVDFVKIVSATFNPTPLLGGDGGQLLQIRDLHLKK